VKDPFGELLQLMLVFWRDALFVKLLAAVVAFSTGFALFTDVKWETLLGVGCLAAMLEITLRSRS
jgi:hypothetical protein